MQSFDFKHKLKDKVILKDGYNSSVSGDFIVNLPKTENIGCSNKYLITACGNSHKNGNMYLLDDKFWVLESDIVSSNKRWIL